MRALAVPMPHFPGLLEMCGVHHSKSTREPSRSSPNRLLVHRPGPHVSVHPVPVRKEDKTPQLRPLDPCPGLEPATPRENLRSGSPPGTAVSNRKTRVQSTLSCADVATFQSRAAPGTRGRLEPNPLGQWKLLKSLKTHPMPLLPQPGILLSLLRFLLLTHDFFFFNSDC